MTSENLQRTTYRDPKQALNPVRHGTATCQENAQDMEQYYLPQQRIHGSSLHGWGVAAGLGVTATLNSPNANLTVSPGVALDSRGQTICLADKGRAEIGPSPTGFSNGATLAPVTATGVVIPTGSLEGDKYLTIAFLETFDDDGYSQGDFRYFHTPWVRLVDVVGFGNDGTQVVLARVSLGTRAQGKAGQVLGLSPELRRGSEVSLGSLHLQGSVMTTPAANVAAIGNATAGVLRANAAGGMDISVPNASDEVHLARDDGGNFAKVSLGAEKIVARQGTGGESVVIDTEAGSVTSHTMTASTINADTSVRQNKLYMSGGVGWSSLSYNAHHNEANTDWVFPDPSHPAITLEMDDMGSTPRFQVWSTTTGNPTGWVERFAIDGNSGNISTSGSVSSGALIAPEMDVTREARVWGNASVGGDLTVSGNLFGKHGDATKAIHGWLYARNGNATIDINLPIRQPVFALITLPGVRFSQAQPNSALAYIDSVDGQNPFGSRQDPANSAWSGEAQTIRFGLTTSPWMEAWALAIVFVQ